MSKSSNGRRSSSAPGLPASVGRTHHAAGVALDASTVLQVPLVDTVRHRPVSSHEDQPLRLREALHGRVLGARPEFLSHEQYVGVSAQDAADGHVHILIDEEAHAEWLRDVCVNGIGLRNGGPDVIDRQVRVGCQDAPIVPAAAPEFLDPLDRNAGTFDDDVRIDPADVRKQGKVPKNGSVFFTIFQTFLSGNDEAPHFGEYPPNFFDFIVVDECHRGGAKDESTWRTILEYFAPAVQLGMTATPKRKDNVDTYKYFGEPVYVYSLKDGINDGFLTPFKVKQISTTMDEYVYTSDDAVIEGAVEPGKLYEEKDFNRIIEIRAREAYRVSLFMGMIDQREKTLVFCASQLHALVVRDLINQVKTSKDPNYCARVTANDGAIGDQFLREFQDNEKTIPTILTTSQKLSTGVDTRNVRNIVLMRPINSMIEFKQIIGRGTRLYDGKDYFTIYDFVQAHKFFSDPEWDGKPEEVATPTPGVVAGPVVDALDPSHPDAVAGSQPPPAKIVVKLADGEERTIESMVQTTFWDPSGMPMSATEFLQSLFGALPAFFQNEADLRAIWSVPDTRKALLAGLADQGFGGDALTEMQQVIDAQDSDLFDVLAYVAFALQPLTRVRRAAVARDSVRRTYTDRQQAFIDFVLSQYAKEGVGELDGDKLTPLLKLRYKGGISDATADLGTPDQIRGLFIGFQRYLYEPAVVRP